MTDSPLETPGPAPQAGGTSDVPLAFEDPTYLAAVVD